MTKAIKAELEEALKSSWAIQSAINEAYYNTGNSDEETANNSLRTMEAALRTLIALHDNPVVTQEYIKQKGAS